MVVYSSDLCILFVFSMVQYELVFYMDQLQSIYGLIFNMLFTYMGDRKVGQGQKENGEAFNNLYNNGIVMDLIVCSIGYHVEKTTDIT